MQAVGLQGSAVNAVLRVPVLALQDEAPLRVMGQPGFPQMLKLPAPGHGIHIHLVSEGIFAPPDLSPNLLPLPFEPVGHVRELRFPLQSGQGAVLVQVPAFAAFFAEKFGSLSIHFRFCPAVRALVEHLMKALSPVGFRDPNAVFFLIAVVIIAQCLPHRRIDLIHSHRLDLLRGEDLGHGGVEGYFPLLPEVPEGGMEMVAVMHHRHHRYFIHADELAQGFGYIRGGAAGGIPGLRVHGEDIPIFQNSVDGFDQVQVHGKLPGADGADQLHQPGTAVIAVNADHVVHPLYSGAHGGQFKIDEVHMVAQHDIGWLQSLHVDLFHLIFFTHQGEL